MKKLLLSIFVIFPFISFGQQCVAVANGKVTVPPLVDLDVAFTANGFLLKFDNWEELKNGKIYPDAIRVYIKANSAWVVKVISNDPFQTSVDGQHTIPCGLISIKSHYGEFMPLTTSPQVILTSAATNSNVENTFYLDLKMITDWNTYGGGYNLNVGFSLSAP